MGFAVGNDPTQVWPGKTSNIENRIPVTKGFYCPQTDNLRVGRVMTFKYRHNSTSGLVDRCISRPDDKRQNVLLHEVAPRRKVSNMGINACVG